jgi:hypothetical protein
MQLLAELLPPAEGSAATAPGPSVGRGLLAATAAAFTARETANRLAQRLQEPTAAAAAGTAGMRPRPIKVRASSTTGEALGLCSRLYWLTGQAMA